MNRIKNQVPKCVLKMLYNSLVLPHMQYAPYVGLQVRTIEQTTEKGCKNYLWQ